MTFKTWIFTQPKKLYFCCHTIITDRVFSSENGLLLHKKLCGSSIPKKYWSITIFIAFKWLTISWVKLHFMFGSDYKSFVKLGNILVSPFFVSLSNSSTLCLKATTLSCVICNHWPPPSRVQLKEFTFEKKTSSYVAKELYNQTQLLHKKLRIALMLLHLQKYSLQFLKYLVTLLEVQKAEFSWLKQSDK